MYKYFYSQENTNEQRLSAEKNSKRKVLLQKKMLLHLELHFVVLQLQTYKKISLSFFYKFFINSIRDSFLQIIYSDFLVLC